MAPPKRRFDMQPSERKGHRAQALQRMKAMKIIDLDRITPILESVTVESTQRRLAQREPIDAEKAFREYFDGPGQEELHNLNIALNEKNIPPLSFEQFRELVFHQGRKVRKR
ncbi:MAG: hypothetical protein NUV67_05945 [archaeon]|nr:hypothetical protein [archaeon]